MEYFPSSLLYSKRARLSLLGIISLITKCQGGKNCLEFPGSFWKKKVQGKQGLVGFVGVLAGIRKVCMLLGVLGLSDSVVTVTS